MSGFRDFSDEGPGTFEWDYVIGGNTTGLFLEEKHYEIDGDTLTEVIYRHIGGNKYEPFYGDSWKISNISSVKKDINNDWLTFEQDGSRFKGVIIKEHETQHTILIDIEKM